MEMCNDVRLKPISPSTLHPIDVNQWNPHSPMAMGMVLDHLGIFFLDYTTASQMLSAISFSSTFRRPCGAACKALLNITLLWVPSRMSI
jgi:hypothetical protein